RGGEVLLGRALEHRTRPAVEACAVARTLELIGAGVVLDGAALVRTHGVEGDERLVAAVDDHGGIAAAGIDERGGRSARHVLRSADRLARRGRGGGPGRTRRG